MSVSLGDLRVRSVKQSRAPSQVDDQTALSDRNNGTTLSNAHHHNGPAQATHEAPSPAASYGDTFADVYDRWYADSTDVAATVAAVARRMATAARPAGRSPAVLELGVGTGRVAVPLARLGREAGFTVAGVDSSPAMLEQLAANDPDGLVSVSCGDVSKQLPAGPFDVVLVTYNTFFNLLTDHSQRACLNLVASRLTAGGCLLLEAFVPSEAALQARPGQLRTVRRYGGSVVVNEITHIGPDGRVEGQVFDYPRSRPRPRRWSIRYLTPKQLDVMAAAAGLRLVSRHGGWQGEPFDDLSRSHVSCYERRA